MEVISVRITMQFDRDLIPETWAYNDGTSNEAMSQEEQMEKNKQIIGAMLKALYKWHPEIGIAYENIAASILKFESRCAFYAYVGMDIPATGRDEIDLGFDDRIPEPNDNYQAMALSCVIPQGRPLPTLQEEEDNDNKEDEENNDNKEDEENNDNKEDEEEQNDDGNGNDNEVEDVSENLSTMDQLD